MSARDEMIEDLEEALSRFFTPDPTVEQALMADMPLPGAEGLVPLGDAAILEFESLAAFAWRFHGIDDLGVSGLAPTNQPVVLRGVTIFDQADETFTRYID